MREKMFLKNRKHKLMQILLFVILLCGFNSNLFSQLSVTLDYPETSINVPIAGSSYYGFNVGNPANTYLTNISITFTYQAYNGTQNYVYARLERNNSSNYYEFLPQGTLASGNIGTKTVNNISYFNGQDFVGYYTVKFYVAGGSPTNATIRSCSITYSYLYNGPTMTTSPNPYRSVTGTQPVSFAWSSVPSATVYDVIVDNNSSFNSPEISSTSSTPSYTISTNSINSSLNIQNTYYVRVKARNANGSVSNWSTVNTSNSDTRFETYNIVSLSSPATNTQNVTLTPTLSWNPISNSYNYKYQISTDPAFNNIVSSGMTYGESSTSVTIPTGDLGYGTTYYWRVAANEYDIGYSAYRSFTTQPPQIGIPGLTSPSGTGIVINPTLSWNSASNATSYRVQLSTSSSFSSTIINETTTSTYKSVSGLNYSTTYYWRVQGINGSTTSSYSSTMSFTTTTPPASVPTVITNEATNLETTTATTSGNVTNTGGTSVTEKGIVYSTTSNPDMSSLKKPYTYGGTGTYNCSLTGLSSGTVYYFRAYAINSAGTGLGDVKTFLTRPAPPILSTPGNEEQNITIPFTLNWASSNGAVTYIVEVDDGTYFSSPIISFSTSDLSYLVTAANGLLPNKTYYWRVAAINNTGQSDWATYRSFKTAVFLPTVTTTQVTNITQSSVIIGGNVTYAGGGTISQRGIKYSVNEDMSNPEHIAALNTGIGEFSITIYLSVSATRYYYQAYAINQRGGGYGEKYSFVTMPAKPQLTYPTNAATNLSLPITLQWNSQPIISSYAIDVATNSTFTSGLVSYSTTGANSYQLTNLNPGTTYYWRVKATNESGTTTWSDVRNFITLPLTPSVTTLLLPANNATQVALNPTLSWNTATNATSYRVQVSTSNNFTTFVANEVVTSTNKALSGLVNLTQYYWRVCSKSATDSSAWSSVWNFTTLPASTPSIPNLSSPANGITVTTLSPTLSWNTATNATSYRVQVSTSNNFTTFVANEVVTSTNKALSGLANLTQYYWRVCSKSATDSSAWSSVWNFTTLPASTPSIPNLSSPANGITVTTLSPTLSWNTATNATSYRVQVSTSNQFLTTSLVANEVVTTTSKVLSGLANSTQYYWRVCSKSATDSSAWSNVWNFTTSVGTIIPPPQTWLTIDSTTGYTANIGFSLQGSFTIGNRALTNGDAIGVFYTRDNQKICGGYLIWNGTTYGMTVWGDDDQTTLKDGFAANEAYTFKVWDGQLGLEWPAEFQVSLGNAYYTNDGITLISSVSGITNLTQNIPLVSGWNLISSYVTPSNLSISNIISGIPSQFKLMKNVQGQTYWPPYLSSLSTWNTQHAYRVYMNSAATLSITGAKILPEQTPIQFPNTGWYWMPYLRMSNQATSTAVAGIANQYSLIKSLSGQMYWPPYATNLTTLEPNKGYMVYITTPTSLTYPANSTIQASGKVDATPMPIEPKYLLSDYSSTGNSATLAIEIDGAKSGDEFGVYTADGLLVGSAVYSGKATGVNIWGDNEITTQKDGASDNEELLVKLFNTETNSFTTLEIGSITNIMNNDYISNLEYKTDGIYLVTAKAEVSSVEGIDNGISISPQPVRNEAVVSFVNGKNNYISIELYDLKGTIVGTYNFNSLNEGINKFRLDVSNLSSGIYNAIIKSGAEVHQVKMIKVD